MAIVVTICAAIAATTQSAVAQNGFDLSNARVPRDEILSGGPPRDGIPSIDRPKFIRPEAASFLRDEDRVLSVTRGQTTRAYPLRVLVWHEIVNDVIDAEPVMITYCPLCGTAMVFDRTAGGKLRTFGVSGLLYQSNILMYDRETESLWSQLKMEAVSGPAAGAKLRWLSSEHLTWKAWKAKYPNGEVLSKQTGYARDYDREAYSEYFANDATMFPVPHSRKDFPPKTWVLGVVAAGQAKAYPVEQLPDAKLVTDRIGGTEIRLVYRRSERHPDVRDASGTPVPAVLVFWFAWQAFYPATGVWKP
ncbi:MAG: DUF3179 domain-containing protein [Acidobacteria bacterium]|nr:DUF3179 domain-containing protein [Acidobacteriota bacterium]